MGVALVRPVSSVAWELRTAWASGRRVALSIEAADETRAEGHVSTVAATDAFCVVSGLHVPLERVLAVHWPSRLGDSTHGEDEPWRARRRRKPPQAERLL